MDNLTRPAARVLAPATVRGLEHLRHLEGPVIFAANHASHVDTPLLLTTLPVEFRHHTVVAAASDYFFDRKWKSILWSFALAAIPIERSKVNRRSADTAAELIEDGWNLVIFPEGGRSPDGWTQPFRPASAAYLARRTGRPVVPVYLHGTRHVLPKTPDDTGLAPGGSGTESRRGGRLRRSPISVLFGAPLTARRRGERPPLLRPRRGGRGHPGPRSGRRLVAGPARRQRGGSGRGRRDGAPRTGRPGVAPLVGPRRAGRRSVAARAGPSRGREVPEP